MTISTLHPAAIAVLSGQAEFFTQRLRDLHSEEGASLPSADAEAFLTTSAELAVLARAALADPAALAALIRDAVEHARRLIASLDGP